MAQKIILVTGANKGIGRAIVKTLMTHPPPGYLIYLTARDASRGEQTLSELRKEVPSSPSTIKFHQLDITDEKSISNIASYFEKNHDNELTALINNAGVAGKGPRFDLELVKWTLECNYYGTKRLTEAMLPLMTRDGSARVVNVSSTAGRLGIIKSKELRDAFIDPKLDMNGIDALMKRFADEVGNGTYQKSGWPTQAYGVSKVGLTALTKVMARSEQEKHSGVLINACCPGWVNTDMTSGKGTRSTEEGSRTPVLLAVGDIGDKTGEFWKDERVVQW